MEKYSKKIGFIPDDWDFIDAKNCLILESGMRPKEYVTDIETDVPSLGGENIDEKGFLVFDNVRYINPNYYRKMTKGHIQDDDIYINKDGANTGKVAYCRKKPFQECAVNEHVFLIRNDGSFIQQFLFYCLLSDKGHKQILKKIIGSAQEGINNSFTKGIILPQPPLAEQTAIAKILSTVDEAIRSTRETISKLERVKKALMQNLLSGKMKPDGTLRPAAEFYEDDKMGLVPKGWKSVKLKEVVLRPGEYGANASAITYEEGKVRFIRITDINDDGTLSEDDKAGLDNEIAQKYLLKEDDFLFARTGDTIGKSLLYKESMGLAAFAGYLIKFTFDKQKIVPELFQLIANSEIFEAFKVSMKRVGAKPNINSREYGNFRFIMPEDIKSQKQIVSSFEPITKQITTNNKKITVLDLLKKSLMQQLLTGRVRVK